VKARRGVFRRRWAWPLAPVYAAVLAVKDGLRRVGVVPVRRLEWPVVSVGSLSAGGAGKTPVTIALAELLRERGWGVDVLSRGYGRAGSGVERVDAGMEGAAGRFGDEPVVMARRLGVPVWVGAERFATGVGAEREAREERQGEGQEQQQQQQQGQEQQQQQQQGRNAGILRSAQNDKLKWGNDKLKWGNDKLNLRNDTPEGAALGDEARRVHLLDDGFQHRGLARAMDVVLVTAVDLEDALLPAGNRREPLRALRRADAVVLRAEERERVEARVRGLMRDGAAIWTVRRELRFPHGGVLCGGPRPVAFCAIARPDGFAAMLAEAGCAVVEMVAFGDHHAYAGADVERLVKVAGEHGATGFVTTEKDAVKLSGTMLERLHAVGPVGVVGLEAKFVDEADVMRVLEARIA